MSIKTIVKKGIKVCDVCGSDNNVWRKCSVCQRDICFSCDKSETFERRAEVCRMCVDDKKVSEIMKRYYQKHRKLVHDELRALARVNAKPKN